MSINSNFDVEDKTNLVSSKKTWSSCFHMIPARYVLTALGFIGFFNIFALRVNLSVALVAMINKTATYNKTYSDECGAISHSNTTEVEKDGEFIWSPTTQAMILGSFFYGYFISQIPGGRMAEVFGGKWLFGLGVFIPSLLTLLTPAATQWGLGALVTLRVFEGLAEGVTVPAMHAMLGCWVPKCERSILPTIVYSGAQIGAVVSMPIAGLLCDSDFLGGWPSVFYVSGTCGCIWFMFWAFIIYETPEKHPRISQIELFLIQTGKSENKKNIQAPPIPWRSILTSLPVWTLMITHFGQNWGFYTFITELPTYLSTVLHFDIKSNGILSGLPYLLQAIVSWVVGYIADRIRQKQRFSINTIRKVCNTIGFIGPAVCLVGVIFAGCNHLWSIVFLILAMGFNGFASSGYMVTHVDMSPEFAGTLMGLSNGFATMTGFLAPEAVGGLTQDKETLYRWRLVFILAIKIYVATGLLYILCGSANLQKWGTNKSEPEIYEKKPEKSSEVDEK